MAKKDKANLKKVKVRIDCMECQSCEKIIEKQAKTVKGVESIKTDYNTGTGELSYNPDETNIEEITKKINEKGYVCAVEGVEEKTNGLKGVSTTIGLIVFLIGAYLILSHLNFELPELSQNASLLLVFTVGLLTGFHCIAMCGGFVVSYTAKEALHNKGLNFGAHLKYGFGKTLSYTVIGGVFGLLGSFITFTPFIKGVAAFIAGLFLVLFGLNMLGLFNWFRRFRLKTPGFVEQGLSKGRNTGPLTTGLLNGLMIACGPLQAMYILAAASGNVYYGALYMLIFGLGTLPVLLGFGLIASIVSSRFTHKLLKFSGAVVILLGLIMLNRGMVLVGATIDINGIASLNPSVNTASQSEVIQVNSEGFQEIRMNVTRAGWEPDSFVLKKGVPVKWIIDGQQITSCNKAIQVPTLGLKFDIKPGLQTIEFTPKEAGTIRWSCWMGMIQGVFIVKEDANASSQDSDKIDLQAGGLKAGGCGSGGCGCGGESGGCDGGCGGRSLI